MNILVINAGSSSLKFALYNMQRQLPLVSGSVDRIGDKTSEVRFLQYHTNNRTTEQQSTISIGDHITALQQLIDFLGTIYDSKTFNMVHAVGHRVVNGGETYKAPVHIDNKVIEAIRSLVTLAPMHNPANLALIVDMQRRFPQLPQVAVFDTAFFHSLPDHAFRYALPNHLYQEHNIRRFGFHGTSHQFVAEQTADYMQQPLETLKLVTLHLGNGASAAAIQNGRCIDTSMGMTPLEGLVMGARCGDLDPSIPFYLARNTGMVLDDIETLLNQQSGLKGLCGETDMREVHRLAAQGNEQARLAIQIFCYRIVKYVAAYTVVLNGIDALVFTAGIGENDPLIRSNVCDSLGILGVKLDSQRNQSIEGGIRAINTADSRVKVLVVPTNEELAIARQVSSLLNIDG